MTTVNASTSLVLVDTTNTSSIVYLSTLQNPGTLITIRDSAGFASANSSIHVSTTTGVSFFDSNFNTLGYRIVQPYGTLTFTPRTSNVWALVNSFAFSNSSNALINTVTASTIVTNFFFQSNGFLSSQQGYFSTIAINKPTANYNIDVDGTINASSFFLNGQPFVTDGNISTLNASSINVNGRLNFAGGLSTFPMSNFGAGVNLMDLLYATSTNRVGIRTNAPNFPLDVQGGIYGFSTITSTGIIQASLTASSIRSLEAQVSTTITSTIQNTLGTIPVTMNTFVNLQNSRSTNLWVAGGIGGSFVQSLLYSSNNGSDWSPAVSGGFTTSNGCRGIAYNGSMWVAAGQGATTQGHLQTSMDGSNWTNTTNQIGGGAGPFATCVAWNGRYWIAGASASHQNPLSNVQYSSNGTNWTIVNGAGFTSSMNGIGWNGRLWVGVGLGTSAPASIEYSFDGLTWSNAASGGFTGNGYGVAWNGQQWVAVGADSTAAATIKYSFDGSNWSNSASGSFTVGGYGVAWNGRMWVAVGNGGSAAASIKYSMDGINWSNSLSGGFTTEGRGVSWNGSRWIATGIHSTAASNIQISSDGINWAAPTSGSGVFTSSFSIGFSSNVNADLQFDNLSLFGKSQYPFTFSTNTMYMGNSTLQINNVMTIQNPRVGGSNVGINTTNPSYTLDVIGSSRFISTFVSTIGVGTTAPGALLDVAGQAKISTLYAVSTVGVNTSSPFYTLDVNGITNTSSFITTLVRTPNTNSNVWVCGTNGNGSSNGLIKYSTNGGSNWTNAVGFQFSGANQCFAICYTGQFYLAYITNLAVNGGNFVRSTDGINWTVISATGSFPYSVRSLIWTGQFFVAAGLASSANSTVARSTDGISWTAASSGGFSTNAFCPGLAFNGRRMIVITNGVLKYSDDQGLNWTNCTGTSFANSDQGEICTNGRLWVAASYGNTVNGSIKYSFDGITWADSASGGFAGSVGAGVAWNGTLFVAVGFGLGFTTDTVKYSYDGINWSNGSGGYNANGNGQQVNWSGDRFIAIGGDSPTANNIKISRDGITWTNSVSGMDSIEGRTICFSSNVVPDLRIDNLALYGKAQYNYVTSTNTMNLGISSITFNSLLTVQNPVLGGSNVGIGTANPRSVLDIRTPSGTATMSLQNNSITGNASIDFWNQASTYIGSMGYGNSNSLSASAFQDKFWIYHNAKDFVFLGSGATERMRVTSSGNVGIGTTTPVTTLNIKDTVTGTIAESNQNFGLRLENNIGSGILQGNDIHHSIIMRTGRDGVLDTFNIHEYGKIRFYTGGYIENQTEKMAILSNGNVGIGISNPLSLLDIGNSSGSNRFAVTRNEAWNAGASAFLGSIPDIHASLWPLPFTDSLYFYYKWNNSKYMFMITGSPFFTGQHGCYVDGDEINPQNLHKYVGLIVSSADKGYVSLDISGNRKTGKDAIWITEALPVIKLTNKDKDKAVFGVVTNHANDQYDTDGNPVLDQNGEWAGRIKDRIRVNGLGEGAIWVTNINGVIENGDYICSSIIPGYGRRQDDDFLHNYTVAKATMSCMFELNQNNYQCEEFMYAGKKYRRAFIGCTYHCS